MLHPVRELVASNVVFLPSWKEHTISTSTLSIERRPDGVFSAIEQQALIGLLGGYSGLTRDAYALDLRQFHSGAPGTTRTCDLRFRKPLLYPLSYGSRAGPTGVAAVAHATQVLCPVTDLFRTFDSRRPRPQLRSPPARRLCRCAGAPFARD